MRLEHASGVEDTSRVRARMATLARQFPGALREIDDLELDEIHRRIERLDAILHGSGEPDAWMEAVGAFHALARGALAVKRWLDGRKKVDATVEAAFAADLRRALLPEEVRGWASDLARIAAPPGGRVTDLVLARVADQLGITPREVRRLIFGRRRR